MPEINPDVFRKAYSVQLLQKLSMRDHSRLKLKALALKGFDESISDQVIKKL